MKSLFRTELGKIILMSFIGLLVGYQWDNIWLGLSIALAIYILSHLYYYRRLDEWLAKGGSAEKPFTDLFWSTIMDQVLRLLSQLRRDKAQLKSDVEYFKESFQALESAVVVVDTRGAIDWCNLASANLLGIDITRDRSQLFNNLIRSPEAISYLEARQFDKPLEIVSPLAIDIRLELQATTFRQNYTLIFARDVTEVFKLESMRRDFVANVSHELRTPLTVITGYLETLRDHGEDLTPVWSRAIAQMLEQSHRMDSMVEDLIWLSRLEALPAKDNEIEVIDLKAILASVVSDAQLSAPNKIVDIDIAMDKFTALGTGLAEPGNSLAEPCNSLAGPLQIMGSYLELRSAFGNLVQNAVKYTAEDGHIQVQCFPRHNKLIVRVVDNGDGIDSLHLPRLTERFYRADSSRTTATGGTGLGLAIVKHILARHDAELDIASVVDEGSQFSCVFPLSRLSTPSEENL
ncbi:MAG: phosphate regulon sensor protein PhoR [Pseudomonadales bacterium]|nr:phosphate regulon sensor protein PhoR [Pseudomonadales bacterium]